MMLFERVRRGVHKVSWSLVTLWVVVCLVLATVGAGFMVLYNDRQELISTNQALINQVKGTGETPVVESPNDVVQGKAGAPGAAGDRGATGERGPAGPRGEMGERGQDGPAGKDGAPGPQGATGDNGASGSSGSDGADGLPGATGETGAAGPVGPQGPKGDTGAAGAPGAAGATGPTGPAGADGRSVSLVACVMDGITTFIVFYDQAGVEIGRVSATCAPA